MSRIEEGKHLIAEISRPQARTQWLKLLLVHLRVVFFNLREALVVIKRYYWNFSFLRIDLSLFFLYLLKSPYTVSKRFLQQTGDEEIYVYGETPLSTLDKIARECEIFSHDVIYDLGCGRGRGTFWFATQLGCTSHGIEMIPEFVEKANRIKRWERRKNVFFHAQDMLRSDFSDATVIYLFGTALPEEVMEKLIEKFSHLKAGTKIITVSDPLPAPFNLVKEFEGKFPWGRTMIYLHTI